MFSSLPNDKILDMTKLKAFADDKLNVAKIMVSLLNRIENPVGTGENAGYQDFVLFPQCLPKPSDLVLHFLLFYHHFLLMKPLSSAINQLRVPTGQGKVRDV